MSFLIENKTDVVKTLKLKNLKKLKKNNRKIAKTRRQRGYQWENTLVKRFNSVENWKAFRLGSPSVALPDVLVVSDKFLTIFATEAKSGTGTTLYVPYYEKRQLREFYKIWDNNKKAVNCVCTYNGNMYTIKNGIQKKLHLQNLHPPFKTRYQMIT